MNGEFVLPPVPDYRFPGFSDSCSVVVGGASGGVGTAVVQLLVEAGSTVVMIDWNEDRTAHLAAALDHPESLVCVLADITTDEGLREMESAIGSAARPVRHLVNVVGGVSHDGIGHFLDLEPEQWARAVATNVTYALRTSQIAAQHMISHGGGAIANLSVADAARAMPWFSFYGATRSALDSLTRTMAVELGPFGIRANTVSWGLINSPRMHPGHTSSGRSERETIPLGRRGSVSDVALAVMYMLSDLAGYVSGQNLAVDGGLALRGAHYTGAANTPVFVESESTRNALGQRFEELVRRTDQGHRSSPLR
ncbi:SDR family NAD(P)-dependent oxidoreductase [Rhodococcus opacus]|uniref:SDR family NAD(P)-dependent oxidoreductase n=1 Tax=Rhodococcus opacus TaxID=37919 RepID=UPI001C4975C8|nr:SDR family oxidoreductase [Rhodococcus opacus]MBV6761740.1 SDR family oxidoreductase [Rhodococcus opacus]